MWGALNTVSRVRLILNTVDVHVNERCRRKEKRSRQGHTKATQHTQGSYFLFQRKNELPRVGFKPTHVCVHLPSKFTINFNDV